MNDFKEKKIKNHINEKNALRDTENLASRFHQVYNKELERQGKKSKHSQFFSKLPQDIADLDRALANYVIEFVYPIIEDETRKETIDTCIQEVREHEIRNDDGNDYITEDTELMREEIVQTLLEIKDE